jgi:hypothetical protein
MSTESDRNEKPHQLIASVQAYGRYNSVQWSVKCPYPGEARDCGVIEECSGTEKDVAKWGCRPYPVEPKLPEGYKFDNELPEDYRQAFLAWEEDVEEWKDEHIYYGDGYGHRAEECWFTHVLTEGDVEPETILHGIPDGTLIVSPLLVSVYYDGSFDETEPNFTLWKEPDDDPS